MYEERKWTEGDHDSLAPTHTHTNHKPNMSELDIDEYDSPHSKTYTHTNAFTDTISLFAGSISIGSKCSSLQETDQTFSSEI